MSLRCPTLLFSLAALVATSSIARADEGTSIAASDRRDHSRVAVILGVATPIGGFGAEYTLALPRDFDLALGAGFATTSVLRDTAGYGDSAGVGRADLQAAAMARYRLRRGAVTFTVGAGLSGGRFTSCSGDLGACENADRAAALWANTEAGLQVSSKAGPFVRLFLGTGYLLAHGTYTRTMESSSPTSAEVPDVSWLPYLGAGVGYAL